MENTDEASDFVYIVTIHTKKTIKSKVNNVPKLGGIFRTIEDANKRAERLLKREYEGELDAGWYERWIEPENGAIHYDDEGCLQMDDFPKEVLECGGYRNLLYVSVTKHKLVKKDAPAEEVDSPPAPPAPPVVKPKKQRRKSTATDGETIGTPAPKKIKLKSASSTPSSAPRPKVRRCAKIKFLLGMPPSSETDVAPSYRTVTVYRFNVIHTKFDPVTLAKSEEKILDDRLFLNLAEAELVFKHFFLKFSSEEEWSKLVNIYGAPGVYYCWDNFNENKLRGLYEGITGSVSEEKINVIFRADHLNDGMVETPEKMLKVQDWDGTEEAYNQHLAKDQLKVEPQTSS